MPSGLSSEQAQIYLAKYGPNQLPDKSTAFSLNLILNQFKNLLTLILLAAVLISFFIGDRIDAVLILVILILNAALGIWQEYKASKELAALRKLEVSTSRVLRDNVEVEISSTELVPEDVVLLEAGDKIPADGILVEAYNLSVNESALTGESLPVIKSTEESESVVYFGTVVVSGRAKMQVNLTGSNTRFGRIALSLNEIEEETTPLEKSLNNLAKNIAIAALFISTLVFAIGILRNEPILEVFFGGVALMVAVVPEGLPAIITVLLALGVRKMYRKKTLVRKMSALESLGATSVICSDKTGTLTKNQMTVVDFFSLEKSQSEAIRAGIICNSASLVLKEDSGSFDVLGDTTEGALLLWAQKEKVDIASLRAGGKIIEEIPFDLKTRLMSVLWEEGQAETIYVKGAPEAVLPLCILSKGESEDLTDKYQSFAEKGLRVLVLARKINPKENLKNINNLEFLGLVGIADEVKKEAVEAIKRAKAAGIKVVMITGDNELTAKAIAEEVGILEEGDEILTGAQLNELTEEELTQKLEKIKVFARVVPEDKLKIVRAYQARGEVVAVTGDGVNDSLALKQAQVGVAMGGIGTDVAKEAADIVILDDNLSTIITSVEEGRVIYSNILKVVRFLLAGNLSEVLLIVVAVILGYPTPLLPVQLLWINFVTDGLPALSLTADPASRNIMSVPPRNPGQGILSLDNIKYISFFGITIALINLLVFITTLNSSGLEVARAVVFTTTVVSQMFFVFIIRKHHSLTSNRYLLYSVGLMLIFQFLIMFYTPLRIIFKLN